MNGVLVNYGCSGLEIASARKWAAEALPLALFTPAQVVAAAARAPDLVDDEAGIYFLQRNGKICYIGKASGLLSRIAQHRGRPFDAVTVIAGVPKDCCASLEAAYVKAWRPRWNAAPCYMAWSGAKALYEKLREMDLSLICDKPELPPLTEAEIELMADALSF